MPKGKKFAGRKKGTPNKATQNLMDKCVELDVDPFEILLRFAKGDWEGLGYETKSHATYFSDSGEAVEEDHISAELRAKCAKDACEYIHAKRKAVEISNPDEQGFRIVLEEYAIKK